MSHIGKMDRFATVTEIDTHFKEIFPLHICRIAYHTKPKVGKSESRVKVMTDCLKEAEWAAAGVVTESASCIGESYAPHSPKS